MMPTWERSAFEVVEAQLGFELLVLLFDRPALMCKSNELRERRRCGQIDEEVFGARREAEDLFAQQPHFGCEATSAPFVGGRHAHRRKPAGPPPIGPIAPRHASPGARRQAERQRAYRDRGGFAIDHDELRSRPAGAWIGRDMHCWRAAG